MLDFNVLSPETVEELLNVIEDNKDNNYRFAAGCTDLILELKKQIGPPIKIINLSKINDSIFNSIEKTDKFIKIGSLVTASEIVKSDEIRKIFPVLFQAADTLASRQIRQVATVGGNICTASPAGDISTALIALEAECEILSSNNQVRKVVLNEFFTGVRKTVLSNNEVLRAILIPINEDFENVHSDFIKIGTRKSMECSIISMAYHFCIDSDEKIRHAGIAIGSSAPTIKFTKSACSYLIGKELYKFDSLEIKEFAGKVLQYASPISDVRSSEWYRKEVLFNISKSIIECE